MSQANRNKLNLMVVDDEPDNLDLLYRTFRRDFRVRKADGALSALEILDQEGEMAVIISDQRMPVMNGTEFLSKTVERFPDTIRILLTGYTDVEDLVEAINSGKVFKYITKPWNPEKLKAVVQQAADTYRVVKQRTNELRRVLRREELLNEITNTIRESLDYSSMAQTIVKTIGENFGAKAGVLRPISDQEILPESFSFQINNVAQWDISAQEEESLLQEVLSSQKTKKLTSAETGKENCFHLAVPLICQQELLAILSLYEIDSATAKDESDIELLEAVSEQAALAISQARLLQRTQQQAEKMRAELEVARQIQNNILRQSWPEVEGVFVQASCFPAREVGGDFFEVYVHPQGDVWLAVADVSGKGVPAALFMASAISVLRREVAQEVSPEPEEVMKNLNRSMSEDLFSTNCFITMVLARYTPSTNQLAYANAGHIYPMLWSHRTVAEQRKNASKEITVEPNYLQTRGIPLGILKDWKGKAGNSTLEQGDIFLLTSDGITEATVTRSMVNKSNGAADETIQASSMLNQQGLWQLLLQESDPLNLDELLKHLGEYTNKVQEDDQTILSLEVM
ncbi:MAG: SpoIIE family protein phosphatase [Spirulinaceae cyanobacterium]